MSTGVALDMEWEKHINEILDDIDHRGEIDGKVVLLCRQVDDVAIAYPTLLWCKVWLI
jgi:hypothetical protein